MGCHHPPCAILGGWHALTHSGETRAEDPHPYAESIALNGQRRVLSPDGVQAARSWLISCPSALTARADLETLRQLSRRKAVFEFSSTRAQHYNGLRSSFSHDDLIPKVFEGGKSGWGPAATGPVLSGLAPVKGGLTYFFSAYTLGDQVCRGQFLDAKGSLIPGSYELNKPAGGGRIYTSAVAPAGAVTARIAFSNGELVGAPAISQGQALQPYSDPEGCEKAVLVYEGMTHGNYTPVLSYSFKVLEVA